jgi:hypothetical protein
MTTWTERLSDAAKAVRDETRPHPYWPESDAGVKSRAREFANHPVGSTLQPFRREYLECFIQRLNTNIGGNHKARLSHIEFRAALTEAES